MKQSHNRAVALRCMAQRVMSEIGVGTDEARASQRNVIIA
jgi:hypothetical protein